VNQYITFNPLPAKTYGNASFNLTATTTSGLQITYTSSNTNVATISGSTVTIVGAGSTVITAMQGGDSNYNPATAIQQTLTVSKATLTATAVDQTNVYGNALPTFTVSYTGLVGTDNASVIDTPPAVSTTATQSSDVGTYPITLGGASDNSYTFNYVGGTLTVTKAVLTATADLLAKTYGDPNPTLTVTYSGLKGTDDVSVIDTQPSPSTTATTTSNVGPYPITLSGGMDNNYSFNLVAGTLTVNKATLTATADPKSKVYGNANPTLTISYTGFKGTDVIGVIDTKPVASTTATTTSNVGTYPISLTGGTDNNYNIALVNGTLTITQATLTATAAAKSKTYGTANPAFTINYTGFKGSDTQSVLDTPPTATSTATTMSNVGSYPITPSGGSDNNYIFTYVNGTLTITKATLTATAVNKTKVYGTANPTLTATYTGFKGTDNATVINVQPSLSTTATTLSDVGTYPISIFGGSDNNYTFTYVDGTLTVTKAALTATADAKTKVYGDENPTLTITYAGFKGTDDMTVIDSPPSASTTATITSNTGTYPITLGGGTDNNYTFTLVNGTLTVTKAPLTATADSKTKSYGDVNPTLTISYGGLKGTDDASVIDSEPLISTTATTSSNVSSYPVTLAGGSDNNYTFTLVNGTLTIDKAILTVTADAKTKVYGNQNPVLTYSYDGFIGTEGVSVLDLEPSISTTAGLYSDVGSYPITLAGGNDNNYEYSFLNSTFTIYREEQSIVFGPLTAKTIGDPSFILFAIGGPTGNPVTFTSSDSGVISVFGNVATVVGTGTALITASQAGNLNYNAAASVLRSITVNASNQTITFNSIAQKYFGDASFNPGATASSGLAISYISSDQSVAVISNGLVQIVGVGSATITATQAGSVNYQPASDVSQTLTVNASPVTVTPATATICMGTGTVLDASGAATYSWSPATGLSSTSGSSVIASPLKTTTYTITATYVNGVTASATATVTVNAIPLAAGGNHSIIKYCGSCGGNVTASGLNTSGQLGDGSVTQRNSPVTLSITDIAAVAAGSSHSLFLKNDGTVWATGLNTNGQLGIGSTSNKNSPTQVAGLTNVVAISAGNTHSLFLKDDGTVWSAGLNSSGQLGDGTTTQSTVPVQVAGLSGIIKISAGGIHSLFLKSDGTVWACGGNTNGQLGDATVVAKSTAFMIPGLTDIIEISAGGSHSHFLKSNGMVWATGLNSNGQLGNGTTSQRTTPTALASINFVTAISAGATHTLFVRNDGTAWATGLNTNSQLGDGTTVQATAPVYVSTLVGVTAVDAGATHSLFLTNDGIVWAAGRNANGQLGDGTTTVRPFPVQIADATPCGRIKRLEQPAIVSVENVDLVETYPNPVDKELTIDLLSGASKNESPLYLFDGFGKIVRTHSFRSGEATKNIDTAELPAGMYLLKVITDNGNALRKIVILHSN
jgi:alpha-tubulin suppressor-like RCC1 family protein